jgi:3'(2'), 5'-bisphosphate nucleotidase
MSSAVGDPDGRGRRLLPMPLPALEALARAAGERIMHVYGAVAGRDDPRLGLATKADTSPVTAADLAAHHVIVGGLRAATPDIPIISEEGVGESETLTAARALVRSGKPYWLVDPLDGTRDFIARSGEFTVNIAYVVGGRPRLGCVFAPVRDELYVGVEHGAAYVVEAGDRRRDLRTHAVVAGNVRMLVSRQHQADEAQALRAAFPAGQITPAGSSLKYCLIARGDADLAARRTPTMLWDTAAAEAVLVAAGGHMRTLAGAELRYDGDALENPPFVALGHDPRGELLQAVAAALNGAGSPRR